MNTKDSMGFQKLEPEMSVSIRNMKIAPFNAPPAPKKTRGKENIKIKPSKKAPRKNLGPWFGENATPTATTGNTEQQTSHLASLKKMVESLTSPSAQKDSPSTY